MAEVYPTDEVVIVPGQPGYRVLKKQESADCRTAALDEMRNQLVAAGCSQVIRATMKAPSGDYLVTGGIFNLVDQTSAEKLYDNVRPLLEANKGRFTGLVAGKGTEQIVLAATQLGWQIRGHYLIYCVIARTDGKAFQPTDTSYANQIIYDIMTLHLLNTVLEKRAVIPVVPSGTAAASAAATG